MPSIAIKKHAGAPSKEEKEKIDKFFSEVKGKVVFRKKVKKAKENLKKAKLI